MGWRDGSPTPYLHLHLGTVRAKAGPGAAGETWPTPIKARLQTPVGHNVHVDLRSLWFFWPPSRCSRVQGSASLAQRPRSTVAAGRSGAYLAQPRGCGTEINDTG
jgi:hypothetical protein